MKIGKLKIYCASCRGYFTTTDDKYDGTCPVCGDKIHFMRCTRCGYMWKPQSGKTLPKACANPKCHTPYWCRERTKVKQ